MNKSAFGRLRAFAGLSFGTKPAPAASKAKLPDYNEYQLTWGQKTTAIFCGAAVMAGIAMVFYKNPLIAGLFALTGLYYPVMRRKAIIAKRKAQLKQQFKQMLASLASSMGAGRSIESSFTEALDDLRLLYPDAGAMIVCELELIIWRLQNGETVEACLLDFSRRAHVDEISQFADVFVICKRTGGSLVQVVRRTAVMIQEKLDIEQDIQVTLAQKKFESKVLTVAPVILIAALAWMTPDYMEPLYQGGGQLIMTGALGILFGCFALAQKIMDIKV
ncbi:type II secretion system F family protein [Paenibacillus ehimensis]|uniref:Type II secretion system F family protein n=1 Tax=Paenibacillus ehimensis TaxID=79264 RepID=A0ABT8VGK0_9BACL|nr:type II secretion system F family protein [Paenibacillus ehimensis]MDO3680079.1 type II secretion system F family protein [Paenibacillus ehimensis]